MTMTQQAPRAKAWCVVAALGGAFSAGAGCHAPEPARHPVARVAPFDLDCPREQLSYTQIDDKTWGVTGCGRRAKYIEVCRPLDMDALTEDRCRWIRN